MEKLDSDKTEWDKQAVWQNCHIPVTPPSVLDRDQKQWWKAPPWTAYKGYASFRGNER